MYSPIPPLGSVHIKDTTTSLESPLSKQELIVLERSARLNLDLGRGD